MALDGRAKIRWDSAPAEIDSVDIAATRYRWLLGEVRRPAVGAHGLSGDVRGGIYHHVGEAGGEER